MAQLEYLQQNKPKMMIMLEFGSKTHSFLFNSSIISNILFDKEEIIMFFFWIFFLFFFFFFFIYCHNNNKSIVRLSIIANIEQEARWVRFGGGKREVGGERHPELLTATFCRKFLQTAMAQPQQHHHQQHITPCWSPLPPSTTPTTITEKR